MKYCSNCGKEIQDNFKVCPYCGSRNTTPTAKNRTYFKKTFWDKLLGESTCEKQLNSAMASWNLFGIILFLIYLIKEIIFRVENDLSDVSIKVFREATGNDLNIIMIIVGITICSLGSIIWAIMDLVICNLKITRKEVLEDKNN